MSTLILALTGHLLGDFIFQTRALVERKRNFVWLVVHCVIVTGVTMLLLGRPVLNRIEVIDYQFVALIFVTHLLIDAIKTHLLSDTWQNFLVDQVLHATVIAAAVHFLGDIATDGVWANQLSLEQFQNLLSIACVTSGYVMCCPFGGMLIGKLTKSIAPKESGEGIEGAGMYIGLLERAIVMTLVLAGELSGIGFLIAAKSILRFGDRSPGSDASTEATHNANRRASEYIIIGTFLSFGWALVIALSTQQLLANLPAP